MIKSLLFTILFIAAGSFGIQAAKPEEQSADQASLTDILPNEVTRMVFEHLSPMQRLGVARACSLWRFLTRTFELPLAHEDGEMHEIDVAITSPNNWGTLSLLVKSDNVKEDIASLLSKDFSMQINSNQIELGTSSFLHPQYLVRLQEGSPTTTSLSLIRIATVQDIINNLYIGKLLKHRLAPANLVILSETLDAHLDEILKIDFLTRKIRSNNQSFCPIDGATGDSDIEDYTNCIAQSNTIIRIYQTIRSQLQLRFLKLYCARNDDLVLRSITLLYLLENEPNFKRQLADIIAKSPQGSWALDSAIRKLNRSPKACAILTNLKNMLPESSVANQEASNKPLLQETTWNTISLLKSPHALLSLVGLAALTSIAYFYQTHRSPANQDNQPHNSTEPCTTHIGQ